jgi:hypothetical protein
MRFRFHLRFAREPPWQSFFFVVFVVFVVFVSFVVNRIVKTTPTRFEKQDAPPRKRKRCKSYGTPPIPQMRFHSASATG